MPTTTTAARYAIVYGAGGRSDYTVTTPRPTVEAARADYNPAERIAYADGMLGGAALVEVDHTGCPLRDLEELAADVER